MKITFVHGRPMPPSTRARLIWRWSLWFADHTEHWHGPIGTQLAHLYAVMAADLWVWLPATSAVVTLLRTHGVSRDESIWRFIRVPSEDAN